MLTTPPAWVPVLLMSCLLVYSLLPLSLLPPRKVLTGDPVQVPEHHERRKERKTRKNLRKGSNWWGRRRKLLMYFKQQAVYHRPVPIKLMSPPQMLVYLLEIYWREKSA